MKVLNVDLFLTVSKYYKTYDFRMKLELFTKFNVLTGNSAIGKTTVHNRISKTQKESNGTVLDYNHNKIIVLHAIKDLEFSNKNDLVIVDEDISHQLNYHLSNRESTYHDFCKVSLQNATCKFLFITRSMPTLPISYKSIFTLETKNDILVMRRMYCNYDQFKVSNSYVTEDTTTGLEYYKHHFENVRSSNGNSNLKIEAKKEDTVIADGSAIGMYLRDILPIGCSMYLPESFEYDLASHWKPKETSKYYDQMPDTTNSVEQYFEDTVLPELCVKNHLKPYSKNRPLDPVLLDVIIHNKLSKEEIKRLSSMCSDAKANELGLTTDYERAMYVKYKFGDSV